MAGNPITYQNEVGAHRRHAQKPTLAASNASPSQTAKSAILDRSPLLISGWTETPERPKPPSTRPLRDLSYQAAFSAADRIASQRNPIPERPFICQ
ncbi:hypothetical protein GCM10009733_005650 [Nonomuraea maheshkhaliensis]|uniref:Uncharacterized protein n=1 Tax=Nonomuraea maheshkhaliensis TaxID=419590 RepID=A0ABP4QM46_9ACTN